MQRATLAASAPCLIISVALVSAFVSAVVASGLSRNRGQAAQVVVIGAVRDGLQVFRISSVGHAHALDVAVLGHPDTLFLGDGRAVRELVAVDFAAVFYETDDFPQRATCLLFP